MKKVSIIIVIYNSQETILACLDHLTEVINEGFAEVILVDNCSPDESFKRIETYSQAKKLIIAKAEKNLGFAGGVNFALDYISGEILLLLNPDATISSTEIKRMAQVLDENNEIGILSPEILDPNSGKTYLSLGFPSLWKGVLDITRVSKLIPIGQRGKWLKIPSLMNEELCEVDWVPGTALMVRKKVVDEIGLFSEDFFMYAEDVEFCWRAKKSGWKVAIYKGAKVLHIGGVSSKGEIRKETIKNSIPNYFAVDSLIIGKKKAFIALCLRAIAYGLEGIHPFRSNAHKRTSKAIFRENLSFISSFIKNKGIIK